MKPGILFKALLLLTCFFTLNSSAMFKNTGYLYKDGKPYGAIYSPSQCGSAMRFAIKELQDHLKQITGSEMPISYRASKWAPGIHLTIKPERKWRGKQSSQTFRIISGGSRIEILGNTETAVLYGVYQYLSNLGCKWLAPGKDGSNIPHVQDIQVKTMSKSYSPSFLVRQMDFASWHNAHFDVSDWGKFVRETHLDWDLWLLRNRVQFARSVHRNHFFNFNFSGTTAGHSLQAQVLKGVDIKKSPERYPLVTLDDYSGREPEKKRISHGGQICFTHPDNVDAAVESILATYKKQDDTTIDRDRDLDELFICDLSLADCHGICECADCLKVAGSGPFSQDRLVWTFFNEVANRVAKKRKGTIIRVFAPYPPLRHPPADIKLAPNLLAQACRTEASVVDKENIATYPFNKKFHKDLVGMRKAGLKKLMNYDYYLYKTTPQPLNLLDAAAAYYKLGFRYYHIEVMQRNAQTWAMLWSLAQFTWNVKQNPRKLLEEYCLDYYGIAGMTVLDILKFYDTKQRKLPRIELGGLEATHMMLPDKLIKRGRKKLNNALNQVNGVYKTRLETFIKTFEMHARSAELYRAYCIMLNERTPKAIANFQKLGNEFIAYWHDEKLSQSCSPSLLSHIKRFIKSADIKTIKPKSRPELKNEDIYLKELFAGQTVPKQIPNLFKLPEIWKLRLDPLNIGLKEKYFSLSYSDKQGWQKISTWNWFEPQGYAYCNGQFWYRLSFKAPLFPKGKKIFLRIGSLDDAGDVYINGKLAFSQKDTRKWDKSFAGDITNLIKPGKENLIVVRGHDSYGGGGIWRPCAIYTD